MINHNWNNLESQPWHWGRILYSKSEQASFTPPLLVSFTDRDLSVPRMWVCVHKDTHKLSLAHIHTDTHSLVPVCEWAALCALHGKPRRRGWLAERLAVPAQWELAVGFRATFSGACSATLHHCGLQTLFFHVDSKAGGVHDILTQFTFSSAAFLPDSEKIGSPRCSKAHGLMRQFWRPPTVKATQHIKVTTGRTQVGNSELST